MEINETTTCGVTTLSKAFGLTAMRVQQLATDGVVVKKARGEYLLLASMRGICEYQLKKPKNQHSGDSNTADGQSYEAHRARLTKAKADKAEVEAALIKGTAHDAQAVAAVWTDMIGNARAKLLALPTKLAAQLEGMTIAERQDAIQAAVAQALTELSDYSPEAVTGEYIRTHQPDEDEDDELDAEPEPNE